MVALRLMGEMVLSIVLKTRQLTSNGSGPDHGVASPMLFVGNPLPHLLNLNRVARSAARGVRRARNILG